MIWIITDLTPLNDGNSFVQQTDQAANDARLSLTSFAEKNHMMAGENGVFDFRDDRLVVADDARQNTLPTLEMAHEILAHFLAHRQNCNAAFFEFS